MFLTQPSCTEERRDYMHTECRGTLSDDAAQSRISSRQQVLGDCPAGGRNQQLPTRSTGRVLGYSRALNAYTVFMALSILVLICSGGLVTSNDAGLAVPDWPTSFGYNMFAFPLSRWLAPGGIRLEHSHRLIATCEGTLTIILALWMFLAEPRRWVRNLAYATLGAVIFQGVLGGLRVRLRADWIGIIHGCFAQAFFALTAVIALVTSRWWLTPGAPGLRRFNPALLASLAKKILTVAVLIYLQLALGATMRHAHAGLSIHDFPEAYGHWWPQVHKADLPAINQERTEILHEPPTTVAQIHLQMMHRLNAGVVGVLVASAVVAVWRQREELPSAVRWLVTLGAILVMAQITLGIYTIRTVKAADVATSHVAMGAVLFVWSVVTYIALRRWMSGAKAAPWPEIQVVAALNTEAVA